MTLKNLAADSHSTPEKSKKMQFVEIIYGKYAEILKFEAKRSK